MSISIFAIGDLHLSGAKDKPMDVFGEHWTNHWNKIREDWEKRIVSEEDIVLIPGDISWAMKLQDAVIDLDCIGSLPGRKVMIKGNHDYWWASISKVRSVMHPSIHVLQNDSINLSGYTFCGTRGWVNPTIKDFTEQDAKIFRREVQRLKLSLESAVEHNKEDGNKLIVLLHYPPFDDRGQPTEMVDIIGQYKPAHVVYGHLHDEGTRFAFEGLYEGTKYHLVSCDYLNFHLKKII
jgi:predicted phosphohydrolase